VPDVPDDPATSNIRHKIPSAEAKALAFSPNGKILGAACVDRSVRLFDSDTGKELYVFEEASDGESSWSPSLIWSPDSKIVGIGGGAFNTVRFHEAETGRPRGLLLALDDTNALVVSPEGHYRPTAEVQEKIRYVVQTRDGQETLTPGEFTKQYGWTNDPKRVRLGNRGDVRKG
jgi:WD40 repeat protein